MQTTGMNYPVIVKELSRNRNVFKELLTGITKDQYRWKSEADKWCLLEIICHIYDEERDDFRARTAQVLENPDLPLPSIDPVGWVSGRQYMEQDFDDKLVDFLEEREKSVEWLKSLSNPKWNNAFKHPKFGPMTANMFLSNWLAHDYLHIRQITRTKYEYLKEITHEPLKYAGNW
ncbi:MAG: DinB family protein [Bacteroidetes bacterium]|nr:DinB family protein [Bacteroidota bacterium]MDA1120113.1 DinB family protein [Bacteroidota bacterium]